MNKSVRFLIDAALIGSCYFFFYFSHPIVTKAVFGGKITTREVRATVVEKSFTPPNATFFFEPAYYNVAFEVQASEIAPRGCQGVGYLSDDDFSEILVGAPVIGLLSEQGCFLPNDLRWETRYKIPSYTFLLIAGIALGNLAALFSKKPNFL